MSVSLFHMKKQKGGRLENIATFCTACDDKTRSGADASWDVLSTVQAGQDGADGFAFVGLAKLLKQDVVVKIMLPGRMAAQEQKVSRMFRERPHVNIVQSICTFDCNDNPVRWLSKIPAPRPLCAEPVKNVIITVQEYIHNGNLRSLIPRLTMDLWWSIAKQLTYACMEWFEYYGFLFGDWHLGNILVDVTDKKCQTYNVFGKQRRVETNGTSPVLTDFARSSIDPSGSLEYWQLNDQIGLIWDLLSSHCPHADVQVAFKQASMDIDECKSTAETLAFVTRMFHRNGSRS